jgi:alpha-1,2-mannosyltransferase
MTAGTVPGSAGRIARRGGLVTLQVVILGLAAVGAWWFVSHGLRLRPYWHDAFDLQVYRGAVRWWLEHRPLYQFIRPHTRLGFTYPPFAVLCMLPLALGTEVTATVLMTAVSAGALLVTAVWLVAPVARRHGWPVWFTVALALGVMALMEPVRETLGWGQVALVLALLVLADVRALDRGRPWAGVGIGLAAAIKVTPAFLVLYLAATRRWRATATAAAVFLGATLLAAAIDPSASRTYWTQDLWRTDRVGNPAMTTNQSLFGVLSRLAAPLPPDRMLWAVLVAGVAVVGLWRAARAARAGDELTGVTLAGLTAALVSPISWTHHFYWLVPAAVVLVDVAAGAPVAFPRRGPPAVARLDAGLAALGLVTASVMSLTYYFWAYTVRGRDGLAGILGENVTCLIAAVLVLFLPARVPAGRAAARTTTPPLPAGSSPR